VADWFELYPRLSQTDSRDEVCFLADEHPPEDSSPRARSARLVRWDGHSGEVEHDGTCDLVLRRTYYPGWLARVNNGPEHPVYKADGGLQAVHLTGAGVSRVSVRYRPTKLAPATILALASTALALALIALDAAQRGRLGRGKP
jgi:hypothetical protein